MICPPTREQMNTIAIPDRGGFRFVTDWQALAVDDGAAIRSFWQRNSVMTDEIQISACLTEVVAHALTDSGKIAAVCTAVEMTVPYLSEPIYHYRSSAALDLLPLAGRVWRASRLLFFLLRHAQTVLENYARAQGFPCIGILVELENTRSSESPHNPARASNGFLYAGKNSRGVDLRIWYFRGVPVKSRVQPTVTP